VLFRSVQNKASWDEEKCRYEDELKKLHVEYADLKRQHEEVLVKNKRLETENKYVEELRKKDLEITIRKELMLEVELKKKSSDAERAAHLLEQLRLKQERIKELESQIGRMERATTSDRHNYERQMHENRQVARKFEKECEEAKKEAETARKEAKLWKEKYTEVEQHKEKLIRPVPNKLSAYIQPIVNPNQFNQTSDSNDISPQSKSIHESSVERDRPPSASSNPGGYMPQMFNQNSQLPHGMSPTPMYHMRGLPPPPMYRPQFVPPPPPSFMPGRMPFDRNGAAPSPDMMSQYMNRMPLMPPGAIPNPNYPSPQQLRQMQTGTPLSMLQQNLNGQLSPGQQNMYNNNDTTINQQQKQQQQQDNSNKLNYTTV